MATLSQGYKMTKIFKIENGALISKDVTGKDQMNRFINKGWSDTNPTDHTKKEAPKIKEEKDPKKSVSRRTSKKK